MKTAYIDLIKFALARGLLVSVWCENECDLENSNSYKAIVDAVKASSDIMNLVFTTRYCDTKGVAAVCADNLEPDETVIDYTVTPFMTEWENAYY